MNVDWWAVHIVWKQQQQQHKQKMKQKINKTEQKQNKKESKWNKTRQNKMEQNGTKHHKTDLISNTSELKMVPMTKFDYLYKIYIRIYFKRKLVRSRIH